MERGEGPDSTIRIEAFLQYFWNEHAGVDDVDIWVGVSHWLVFFLLAATGAFALEVMRLNRFGPSRLEFWDLILGQKTHLKRLMDTVTRVLLGAFLAVVLVSPHSPKQAVLAGLGWEALLAGTVASLRREGASRAAEGDDE